MSKGAGKVERRIADLFAATRDKALSIGDLADNAYELGGRAPTREQRLSATRAAHRLLRRVKEADARAGKLFAQAHADVRAALGRSRFSGYTDDKDYEARFGSHPARIEGCKLSDFAFRIGRWSRYYPAGRGFMRAETDFWQTSTVKGRLYFHSPDVPVRVWAVSIGPGGVAWHEAEVVKVTVVNVMARYAAERARLDRRQLWRSWAWWRGVMFVSSRTGRIAAKLEELWWEQHGASGGAPPPSMQMPLADAMALLGVPENYTKEDVLAAFRKKVKLAHPDLGGTAEMFQKLVEARDRLLNAIGAKARPPKAPQYAPKGVQVVYRVARPSGAARLSAQRRLR